MEVEIISEESIKPSSPTPHHLRTYNLSLLDYLVGYPYVPIVFYYPNHNDNDNNIFQALQRSLVLKKSLSETLTQFYPLAGTLKGDSIECNDVGANYVLVLVHGRLDGFLHKPDLGLINRFLPLEPSFDQSSVGSRVTNVKVNIFKCGGIAVGLCVSHKILDGAALYTFLKGWANMASKSEEVTYPKIISPLVFPAESLRLRDIFQVSYQTVLKEAALKVAASRNGVQQPTRVEVVSALLWKCTIAASKEAYGIQKTTWLNHSLNLRKKLPTKTSKDLIGNMMRVSSAVCKDNDETTLHSLVNKVHDSIVKVNDEFVNEAQGDEWYVAMHKLLQQMGEIGSVGPTEYYIFTSWCKMGFNDIDFGWGKPSWVSGLIGKGFKGFFNLVTLMDTKCGEGVEAWVTLDEEELKILQCNPELLAYASVDPSPLSNDHVI
ncbi:epi-neemfruitin B 7-O-acetyltransferse L7AT-like [Bidens hawaiensis]|uniref:epi-neemfruitin B 7-O-acetyltransferse L7AT-like n=1 Tax=Bidens hawaiensis TaxID=980011 RepID=UPI004049ECDB